MATAVTAQTLPDGFAAVGRMSLTEFRQQLEKEAFEQILLAGQVWERPMTRRNRVHAGIEARITQFLSNWADQCTSQEFRVFSGEVGCEFPEIESSFGIDVAVFSTAVLQQQSEASPYLVGRPELAVEILSPSDSNTIIYRKIDLYLAAQVPLIWQVNPLLPGVLVFQPGQKPELLTEDDLLTGKDILPEFQVSVSQLFQ